MRLKPVFALINILFILCANPAVAQVIPQSGKFTVTYGAYAGGFHVLTSQLDFDLAPSRYSLVMNTKPYGVIGYLLPWGGEYKTSGIVQKGKYIPVTHNKISRWRDDHDQSSFVYRNGVLQSVKSVEVEGGKTVRQDRMPDPSFHKNSVDILTSAVEMLSRVGSGKTCDGKTTVFDGRRRFELLFESKGIEKLKASNLNMFSGDAEICEVEMKPLLGYSGKPRGYYKIQEEARAMGQLPRVWLGRLWPNGPMLPVKLLVKSDMGAVFLHAQRVSVVKK